MLWQPVIGLEIHVQLNTQTKLFASSANRFGDEPNTNISVVCTAQPGTLPKLNKAAVDKAIRLGLALNSTINRISTFDRKSYFYPDSPRNYQITQFYTPIIQGGFIEGSVKGVSRCFSITSAHLEDDAGMLKHFTNFAGVDYNRAGSALIEIVSEPCMHSAEEAVAYAQALKELMIHLDITDGNMEEGSLRMDVNISVRPMGSTELRNRIEIKNINSFAFMHMAIEAEIKRQISAYTSAPDKSWDEIIPRSTYRFDTEKKEIVLMRVKEAAEDYRYFPEPDLPPLHLSQEHIDRIKQTLPQLPSIRRQRYQKDYGLSDQVIETLLYDPFLCSFFDQVLQLCPHPKSVITWMLVELQGKLKELNLNLKSSKIKPENLAQLVLMIESKTITGKLAKTVVDRMIADPHLSPEAIVANDENLKPMSDQGSIEALVIQVLEAHPQSVIDFKHGKDKALAFLVGQVMKLSKGTASPDIVNQILKQKIN
jgi:aspartyl-tRNA(Asn)/glutamyl-tRNA(Gln) amidotransferase subunit B